MYTVLPEWLDANRHRQFPLTDDAVGRDTTDTLQLPQSFIVDLFINVPESADVDKVFISNILIRRYTASVTVAYDKGGSYINIGTFDNIDMTATTSNLVYDMSALRQVADADKEFQDLTGVIVIGTPEDMANHPGSWTFTAANTAVMETSIARGISGVRQISVGSDIFSGRVKLKEGSNISISSYYDGTEDETVITINATSSLDNSASITSDADIMASLISTYGQPLVSINNITPDNTGNFNIVGTDCINVAALALGAGLTIDNPCGSPCCDKSYLENAYGSLDEINARYARVNEFLTNLQSAINDMQNKLGLLQMNASQE